MGCILGLTSIFRTNDAKWFIRPITDPDNIDKRRAEVGLCNFQEYISDFGLTWNVEEYKKNLPELMIRINYLNTKYKQK